MRELKDLTTEYVTKGKARAYIAAAVAKATATGPGLDGWLSEFDRLLPRSQYRDLVVKAAVTAVTTDEIDPLSREFVALLRRQTVLGRLAGARPAPPFVRFQALTSGTRAGFVAEGAAIPASAPAFGDPILLLPAKIGTLVPITRELARSSDPSALNLIESDVVRALIAAEDGALLDEQAAVPNERPASILFGTTPVGGGSPASIEDDVAALVSSVRDGQLESPYFVTSTQGALWLARQRDGSGTRIFPEVTLTGGSILGVPVLVTQGAGGRLVLVDAAVLFFNDQGVDIDQSGAAALQLLDNPTASSATATATTTVSMFQTNSVALRGRRFVTWQLGTSDGAGFIELPVGDSPA